MFTKFCIFVFLCMTLVEKFLFKSLYVRDYNSSIDKMHVKCRVILLIIENS